MSLYIDQKFVGLLQPQLQGFSKKKDYLYNFRCPYCGDSSKKKNKKRGYVYRKTSGLFFMCHNCAVSTTLGNLIKFVSPTLHKDYVIEEYKDANYGKRRSSKKEVKTAFNFKKTSFGKSEAEKFKTNRFEENTIFNLPDDDPAKEYIVNRQIPESFQKEMFVVEDFKKYVDSVLPDNPYTLYEGDRRIVIPMKDKTGTLVGFQGRAIGKSELRYITIKVKDDIPKVYGMDRINLDETVYVVEGPIDSMFLDNAIAMAGADMTFDIDKKKSVVLLDNEKRNKDITRRMANLIKDGYKICIWPEGLIEKDINDMILSGMSKSAIKDIIDTNTFSGLSAKLALQNWIR